MPLVGGFVASHTALFDAVSRVHQSDGSRFDYTVLGWDIARDILLGGTSVPTNEKSRARTSSE